MTIPLPIHNLALFSPELLVNCNPDQMCQDLPAPPASQLTRIQDAVALGGFPSTPLFLNSSTQPSPSSLYQSSSTQVPMSVPTITNSTLTSTSTTSSSLQPMPISTAQLPFHIPTHFSTSITNATTESLQTPNSTLQTPINSTFSLLTPSASLLPLSMPAFYVPYINLTPPSSLQHQQQRPLQFLQPPAAAMNETELLTPESIAHILSTTAATGTIPPQFASLLPPLPPKSDGDIDESNIASMTPERAMAHVQRGFECPSTSPPLGRQTTVDRRPTIMPFRLNTSSGGPTSLELIGKLMSGSSSISSASIVDPLSPMLTSRSSVLSIVSNTSIDSSTGDPHTSINAVISCNHAESPAIDNASDASDGEDSPPTIKTVNPSSTTKRYVSVTMADGRTRFACTFEGCNKTFARQASVNMHAKVHYEGRSFECELCTRKFHRRHDLKRHVRLHSGNRPYVCPNCMASFPRSDSLNRHIRTDPACLDYYQQVKPKLNIRVRNGNGRHKDN